MVELNKGNGGPEEVVKKERKRSRKGGSDVGLNINSMMDIMTILLVFLLISITSDPLTISQNAKLKLAKSTANYPAEKAIPITITADMILVDKDKVVDIECITASGQQCRPPSEGDPVGDYARPDNKYSVEKFNKLDADASQFQIVPLFKRLKEIVDLNKQKAAAAEKKRDLHAATIVAHVDIPYRIIAEVVYTAGLAELSNLRFAILKTSQR